MLAFVRVLRNMDQHKDLVVFLEAILDWEPPPLHRYDYLAYRYFVWKSRGLTHKIAFEIAIMDVPQLMMPELDRDVNLDQVLVDPSKWGYYHKDLPSLDTNYTLPVLKTR